MAIKLDKETKSIIESDGQYILEPNKRRETEAETYEDVPQYRISLDLTDEQKARLTKQFAREFKAICDEHAELGLPEKWKELDALYDGEMKKNDKLAFSVHVHQAKIKENAIVRALNEACLDSEPMMDISPRPGFALQNGQEICDRQQSFAEYSVQTEVRPHKDLILINHDTVRKFVGIGKIAWDYKKDQRRREEVYEGKNEPMMGANGQPVVDGAGNPMIENKAFKEFMNNYPDADKRYPTLVKQIAEGKRVRVVVKYYDVVSNNPVLRHVPIEKFKVRNSCKYNHGLAEEHLVAEEQEYTWWELERKERNEEFENIDELITGEGENEEHTVREYTVHEATMYFRLKEDDEVETKIKAWFGVKHGGDSESSKSDSDNRYVLLGSIYYPYFGFDIDYIGFWVKLNGDGFYGNAKSVTYDLKDTNIALDALLQLALHSAYIRNILTPIVREGSEMESQFIENRFLDGKPISIDMLTDDISKEYGFVTYPTFDVGGLLALQPLLSRVGDDVSGVTQLMTGRENPSDPRAPAMKTMALLNQSGINIKDYIRTYVPSFNIFIENLLQLYYQMSQDERKFRVSSKGRQVSGGELFLSITRDQMIAKTTIQSRAAAFAFDKVNEKQENMAMYQVVRADPYLMTKPESIYAALMILLKSWSPTWKAYADSDLPSPEQFKSEMEQAVMKAIVAMQQQQQIQEQLTGAPGQPPQPEEVMQAAANAKGLAYNPALGQPPKGRKQ